MTVIIQSLAAIPAMSRQMTGAPADIGVIEAAYHDGVGAGVAAYVGNDVKRLIEARRVRLVTGFVAERAFCGRKHCLCVPKTSFLLAPDRITYHRSEMIALVSFYLRLFTLPLKSKIRLEAENAILRHQLIVLERKIRGAFASPIAIAYSSFGSIVGSLNVGGASDHPTRDLVRWHRAGFRRYWRWRSRSAGGRPQINADLRALIRQITANY